MNAGEAAFFVYITIFVVVLLPMMIFRRSRPVAAMLIVAGSWLSGFILWITAVGILYFGHSLLALAFGLVFFGIGVVPVAWILALIHWEPNELGDLAILTAGTFLPRLVAVMWIAASNRPE
jgi:hypothetical protein